MSIIAKKQKISFFIVLILSIVSAVALFFEGALHVREYYRHMTGEITKQYEEKEQDYVQVGELISKIFKAFLSSTFSDTEPSSQQLRQLFDLRHAAIDALHLKQNGIQRIRFYSVNTEVLFDSETSVIDHDTPVSLGFNPLLQRALSVKEAVYGYQIMSKFQGFTAILPMKVQERLVGYLEISVPFDVFLKEVDATLMSRSLIVYDAKPLAQLVGSDDFVSIAQNNSLVVHQTQKAQIEALALGKLLSVEKVAQILREDGISQVFVDPLNSRLLTLIPLYSFNQVRIGYIIATQTDSKYWMIVAIQAEKYLGFLCILWVLYFVYRKHLNSELLMEQYKNIVDLTTIVSKTDIHGKIIYVNEAFEKLSGYEAKELLGHPHNIVRAPEMPRSVFKEMWETIQKGHIWQGKITNLRKDGERYTVQATIVPLKNAKGKIIEYMALRYDITELEAYRHILEDRLLKTDDDLQKHISLITQYQKAIEQASSFCRYDATGMITYVNETMCRISQCSEEELIHHNVVALNLITPDKFQTILDEVNHQQTWKGVIECNHKKDITCYLDATFSPIVEGNTLKEIMCISHDVTPIYNLYQEIEDTQKEVVFTMGAIGESRSKETGNHVKRVAEYSKRLALLSGLSSEEAELLKQASPMHDIGKVAIPDAILQKPGKLTEEEWVIMQTHCQLGYDMLAHSSREILKAASIVAYEHHEKWNGKGYPRGLKEEAIHIYGRITAIADVFDALGSDRCYKKAWDDEMILELFRKERGEHFDPRLVDLFLENIALFYEIRTRFQ